MVVRLIKKCSILPVACLSLAMFGSGCDNSGVNEENSGGKAPSGAAVKDGPPPPKSVKEWSEQNRKIGASPKANAASKTGAGAGGAEKKP